MHDVSNLITISELPYGGMYVKDEDLLEQGLFNLKVLKDTSLGKLKVLGNNYVISKPSGKTLVIQPAGPGLLYLTVTHTPRYKNGLIRYCLHDSTEHLTNECMTGKLKRGRMHMLAPEDPLNIYHGKYLMELPGYCIIYNSADDTCTEVDSNCEAFLANYVTRNMPALTSRCYRASKEPKEIE